MVLALQLYQFPNVVFLSYRTKYEIEKLQHEEGFVLLCHSLRKLAPHINSPTDLINCLKTLMMCEVDSESRVILTLISQLKAKVNDLSLRNISYLEVRLFNSKFPLRIDSVIIGTKYLSLSTSFFYT